MRSEGHATNDISYARWADVDLPWAYLDEDGSDEEENFPVSAISTLIDGLFDIDLNNA